MSVHASSRIAWIAVRTAGMRATVIDHLKSWASRRSISFHDQNPESPRTVVGPVSPGAPQVRDELVDEAHHASRRPRGPFAHAGAENLAGVGACSEQRVIAELFGVAVRGALFLFAVDLADRGVQIDHQRRTCRGLRPAAQARASVRDSTASSWRM